jgi:hypothetical protein
MAAARSTLMLSDYSLHFANVALTAELCCLRRIDSEIAHALESELFEIRRTNYYVQF